jgi:hypothetical protein
VIIDLEQSLGYMRIYFYSWLLTFIVGTLVQDFVRTIYHEAHNHLCLNARIITLAVAKAQG